MSLTRTISAAALSMTLLAAPLFSGQTEAKTDNYKHRYKSVQLLAINDFHGKLNVTRTLKDENNEVLGTAGGADYLAAYLREREQENKNTLMLHNGDMVGASPPVSALLQDEPTIEYLNMLGFDVGTLGNHSFDEGTEEMLRLINGGYHEETGDFAGADFPYTAANVLDKETGEPILPPYVIKKVNGMPIGFIGVVTTETPSIVIPEGVENVEFIDEAEAINKAAAELKAQGVEAIVVMAHVPGSSNMDSSGAEGELVDLANAVDDEVDIIYGGHNHAYMDSTVDGKLLVQSYSYGTAFSDVDLLIDPKTKDIVQKEAEIVTTFHEGIEPAQDVQEFVASYEEQVAPLVEQVVATADEPLTRVQDDSGESPLGNLIADAQRATMETDFAFMNPGGVRDDINAGDITWGELYNVQPFNNTLVEMTLTGEQIYRLLEQQWQDDGDVNILQVSGLNFTWDADAPVGDKIVSVTTEDGTELDPDATYSVTVNSFMASGGDDFTVLTEADDQVTGPVDLDALVDYLEALDGPVTAPATDRIDVQ